MGISRNLSLTSLMPLGKRTKSTTTTTKSNPLFSTAKKSAKLPRTSRASLLHSNTPVLDWCWSRCSAAKLWDSRWPASSSWPTSAWPTRTSCRSTWRPSPACARWTGSTWPSSTRKSSCRWWLRNWESRPPSLTTATSWSCSCSASASWDSCCISSGSCWA